MDLPALPSGVTAVNSVRLYSDKDRTENVQTLPAALVDGVWTVDTLNVADGRWYATVDAQKGAVAYTYPLRDPVDLPEDDRLVISPETLAVSIKMPLPLDDAQRETLTQAILDAQDDVYAYLGQPITPQEFTQSGLWPLDDEWLLTAHGDGDVVKITAIVGENDPDGVPLGTFTVTYLAGIDARNGAEYGPIRRYIKAHAANSPEVTRLWRAVVNPEKTIKSSSTQGQSVSYEVPTLGGGGSAGSGNPGALPTIGSLSRWKVAGRRVHQPATRVGVRYL